MYVEDKNGERLDPKWTNAVPPSFDSGDVQTQNAGRDHPRVMPGSDALTTANLELRTHKSLTAALSQLAPTPLPDEA